MPDKHSHIGASSAYRWLHCPGSVRLYDQITERHTSEYARTGTLAHLVAELCLRQDVTPSFYLDRYLALGDGNALQVTEAIVEAVAVYVDLIRDHQAKFGGQLVVEQEFDLSWIYPGMFGTNDASLVPTAAFGTLRVYDYKNGRKQVDVYGNPQLMYYALGALGEHNLSCVETVVAHIVQPNGIGKEPIDVFEIKADDLYQWGMDILRPGAARTQDPDAPCVQGEWCCFCEAAAICPLRKQAALALLDDPDEAHPVANLPDVKALPLEQVGMLSSFFQSDAFTSWVKALAAEEQAALARGEKVPGRKLVENIAKGNRKWVNDSDVIVAFKDLGEEIFNNKVKSPAQLEKVLVAHGKDKSLVDPFVTREETTKILVVDESDERPSVEERKQKAIDLF